MHRVDSTPEFVRYVFDASLVVVRSVSHMEKNSKTLGEVSIRHNSKDLLFAIAKIANAIGNVQFAENVSNDVVCLYAWTDENYIFNICVTPQVSIIGETAPLPLTLRSARVLMQYYVHIEKNLELCRNDDYFI